MLVGVLEVNCTSLSAALFSGSFCCVDKETLITVEKKWEKYAVMVEDRHKLLPELERNTLLLFGATFPSKQQLTSRTHQRKLKPGRLVRSPGERLPLVWFRHTLSVFWRPVVDGFAASVKVRS